MSLGCGPALAQDAAIPADEAAAEGDAIVVFGKGETRQVQEVKAADIAVLLPGTSAIRAIEKLPSVNIQSADAFGNYEWSTRVTIRSFNQNQLGFTLDGVPLGDMSYGNHNGLHISRAIISENVARVDVAQGSGALGTASSSNLGGTSQFLSRRPAEAFGHAEHIAAVEQLFRDGGAERFAEAIDAAMRTSEGTTIWYLRVIHHLAQDGEVLARPSVLASLHGSALSRTCSTHPRGRSPSHGNFRVAML